MEKVFNDVLLFLNNENCFHPPIMIEIGIGLSNKANSPVKPVLVQLEQMGLILKHPDPRYTFKYAINQLAREEMATLPYEFKNNPYGYFKEKAKRVEENATKKQWYESENAKQQFEDYPDTKRKANISYAISIITLILLALTTTQQLMCNKLG